MPMKQGDFGTNTDGSVNREYCTFCFRNGRFTQPITVQQMVERAAGFMVKLENMPESRAKRLAETLIPALKRWQG